MYVASFGKCNGFSQETLN